MRNKLILFSSILLFSFSFPSLSQKLINSPFSRFNIGTLEPAGSFRSLGMGGIGISLRDNSSIYFSNPASYSSLDTTSFVFDFGLDYSMIFLSDGISKFKSDDINFNHLLIGFPVAKGWGVAAGIIPLSNGYYQMSETVKEGDPDYNPITGEYTAYHAGEGSFSNFFVGTGVNIFKNLAVGANLTILFGEVKRTNQFAFTDLYNVLHDNKTENLQLNGINFDYGFQYTASLKKDYFFNAGASLTSSKYYKSKYENLSYLFSAYSTRDTLSYFSDESSKALLPGTLRFGVSFGKINKLVAGVDYISTAWSKAKIHGSEGYLANTRSWLIGAEYIPDKYSNYNYLKRVEYRLGGHIEDNYLILNNEQIKEYGMTIGLGLPMRRSLSKTNLYFDLTRKSGSIANNLHNENYYTFGISLNLYDSWFIKRKYD